MEKHPELMCVICHTEMKLKDSFVTCADHKHVTCYDCLEVLLLTHKDQKQGKIKNVNGEVYLACSLHSRKVPCHILLKTIEREKMKREPALQYLDFAEKFNAKNDNDDDNHDQQQVWIERIFEAMNTKCPLCDQTLDTKIDGCCAIFHEECGTRFCWVCLEWGFKDSVDAHEHVRRMHGGNVYLSVDKLKDINIQRQERQVFKVCANMPMQIRETIKNMAIEKKHVYPQNITHIVQGEKIFTTNPTPFNFEVKRRPVVVAIPQQEPELQALPNEPAINPFAIPARAPQINNPLQMLGVNQFHQPLVGAMTNFLIGDYNECVRLAASALPGIPGFEIIGYLISYLVLLLWKYRHPIDKTVYFLNILALFVMQNLVFLAYATIEFALSVKSILVNVIFLRYDRIWTASFVRCVSICVQVIGLALVLRWCIGYGDRCTIIT